jgi:DNA repair exonuclease SbcCD ATPase subunit
MIKIKNVTAKNFLSIGNQTQAVNLDSGQLTLVLGENLDLGGDDSGARNGVGKTAILNAISYAIFGQALTNIKKDNLINKINNKNMLVTVNFEKDSIEYHIERGRKPNFLKFVVNGHEHQTEDLDESQGDSRETQKAIEECICMSHDMFKHLVALNTYNEPFLSMKAADQRAIIEQLLGITILSEKSESLKEEIKKVKEDINFETTKIELIKTSNEKIIQSIESLERKKKLWDDNNGNQITELEKSISFLEQIDIEKEIEAHRCWDEYNKKQIRRTEAEKWIARIISENGKLSKQINQLEKDISDLKEHRCYACGQSIHDLKQEEILKNKEDLLKEVALQILANQTQEQQHRDTISEIGELVVCPQTQYDNIDQAYSHRSTLESLKKDLINKKQEINPYQEQIMDLKNTALQTIDWSIINDLTRLKEHQEFLYKLLTSKDSFIRKKIIDQNLSYLNQRLTYYLNIIGLPHLVEFQNDLSVLITQLGQDLDFDNLSRGERNRLILSMSWAFRDVWENLYHPINLLFIDELVDSGMDSVGVESSISILKKMTRERNKSVFLISHRDDLTNRVNQVLKVIKENGFTSYSNDMEIVE